jgi:hypothetical protein
VPGGLYWFIPGVAGGIPCDAWCSAVGLQNVLQASLEFVQQPTSFLSVMWCGEKLSML